MPVVHVFCFEEAPSGAIDQHVCSAVTVVCVMGLNPTEGSDPMVSTALHGGRESVGLNVDRA